MALDRRLPARRGRADHRHRHRHARLNPADAVSGTIATAGRAANAVNVAVAAPAAPRSSASRSSRSPTRAPAPRTHVFAQIVDEARGVVVGNQATPIPLTLDGQPHTITPPAGGDRRLRARGRKYTLQLTGGTLLYGPVRGAAAINFTRSTL